jgi:hypothetical protein
VLVCPWGVFFFKVGLVGWLVGWLVGRWVSLAFLSFVYRRTQTLFIKISYRKIARLRRNASWGESNGNYVGLFVFCCRSLAYILLLLYLLENKVGCLVGWGGGVLCFVWAGAGNFGIVVVFFFRKASFRPVILAICSML